MFGKETSHELSCGKQLSSRVGQISRIFLKKNSGAHLFSHIVTNIVPSAVFLLTVVFGMGTSVSPKRINTRSGTKWTRTTDLTLIRRAL